MSLRLRQGIETHFAYTSMRAAKRNSRTGGPGLAAGAAGRRCQTITDATGSCWRAATKKHPTMHRAETRDSPHPASAEEIRSMFFALQSCKKERGVVSVVLRILVVPFRAADGLPMELTRLLHRTSGGRLLVSLSSRSPG